MKRFTATLRFLFLIVWWAWIPVVLGIWWSDDDFPRWIRKTVYTMFGVKGEKEKFEEL